MAGGCGFLPLEFASHWLSALLRGLTHLIRDFICPITVLAGTRAFNSQRLGNHLSWILGLHGTHAANNAIVPQDAFFATFTTALGTFDGWIVKTTKISSCSVGHGALRWIYLRPGVSFRRR